MEYGTSTKTFSFEELGFSITGKKFKGWKIYRQDIRCWRVMEGDGTQRWAEVLRDGWNYYLYGDGCTVAKTAPAGAEVHFYAQWEDSTAFSVYYHRTDTAPASNTVTDVEYGTSTKTVGYEELGFSTSGKKFMGWRVYRADTKCWRVINSQGVQSWSKTIPTDGDYCLYDNKVSVSKTALSGSAVHFYGQWEDCTSFSVYYHLEEDAEASAIITEIEYGVSSPIQTVESLGYYIPGKAFMGWKVYRSDTKSWRVVDALGTESWSKTRPEGSNYVLYGDGWSLSKTVPAGAELHLYGQWENTTSFSVHYHRTDETAASSRVTNVEFGTSTQTIGYESLGFSIEGKRFIGWKVYRADTQCWRVVNSSGVQSWSRTVPEEGDYYLYANECSVSKTAPAGTDVHFYGQWEDSNVHMESTNR